MSSRIVQAFVDIGNAIRNKQNYATPQTFTPSEMCDAIFELGGGQYSSPKQSTSLSGALTNIANAVRDTNVTQEKLTVSDICERIGDIYVPTPQTVVRYKDGTTTTLNLSGVISGTYDKTNNQIDPYTGIPNIREAVQIDIGSNITGIGDACFAYCYELVTLNLPPTITSIGSNDDTIAHWVFYGSTNLRNLYISNGLTTLPKWAFYYENSIISINFPKTVLLNKDQILRGCSSLKKVSFHNEITSYSPRYMCQDCTQLVDVKLSESASVLPVGMFYQCTALQNIKIPKCVNEIQNYCFYGCTGLSILDFSEHEEVPILRGAGAFTNTPNKHIVVPDALYDDWIASSIWSASGIVESIVRKSQFSST